MRKLKNWLESYMEFTENTEPPKVYNLWCGISCLAACLRRKVYLTKGFDTFYPNFYIVLVGKSAVRKGTAMKPAKALLDEVGVYFAGDAVTREQLIRELMSAVDSYNIGERVYNHCSLTVFSPELTVFLGYNNTQLMANLVDWYDCAPKWENKTKNKGIDVIRKVWLNLLGATTPDLIRSTMPRDLIGGGLSSRMIFVYADQKYKTIPNPNYSDQLKESLIYDLMEIYTMNGEFKEDSSFKEIYEEWYKEESENSNSPLKDIPEFDGYMGRRAPHILKLSMIMNVSRDGQMKLEAEDFRRALEILERTEMNMPRVFGGFGESDKAAIIHKIMGIIATNKQVSTQDLHKSLIYDISSKEELSHILATLEQAGFCQVIIEPNKATIVRYLPESGL